MEMSKEVLYQSIGELIVDSIGETWSKATVKFEVLDEDVYRMECVYETTPNNVGKSFVGGIALYDLFLELRRSMEEDGTDPWRKAIFELSSSGLFQLDFDYLNNDDSIIS